MKVGVAHRHLDSTCPPAVVGHLKRTDVEKVDPTRCAGRAKALGKRAADGYTVE